jgi:hypothetical protein
MHYYATEKKGLFPGKSPSSYNPKESSCTVNDPFCIYTSSESFIAAKCAPLTTCASQLINHSPGSEQV